MHRNIKPKIVFSKIYDPWFNLALEEAILNSINKGEIFLYIWQNDKTVIIGKNQNPWKECNITTLKKNGGKIARRITGGGAVYHDLGNVNFSFLVDKEQYDQTKQFNLILNAIKKLGINAELSGRNDIIANGRKFSGNAFYVDEHVGLHHGTILVNTDISRMIRYLNVSKEKIISKGIDSVKARVVNLKDIKPEITVEAIINRLIEEFKNVYGNNIEIVDPIAFNIEKFYEKHSSWEWIYGETPDFNISFSKRFIWGEIEFNLQLEKGKIVKSYVYSDAIETQVIEKINLAIKDLDFNFDTINESLRKIDIDADGKELINNIIDWLSNINI